MDLFLAFILTYVFVMCFLIFKGVVKVRKDMRRNINTNSKGIDYKLINTMQMYKDMHGFEKNDFEKMNFDK